MSRRLLQAGHPAYSLTTLAVIAASATGACSFAPVAADEADRRVGLAVEAVVGGEVARDESSVFALWDAKRKSLCSAVLIDPCVALTARHCVQEPGAAETANAADIVLYDSASIDNIVAPDPHMVPTQHVASVIHAAGTYDAKTIQGHDIAALIFDTPAKAEPIKVRRTAPAELISKTVRMVGYGALDFGSVEAPYARRTRKPLTLRRLAITAQPILIVDPGMCGADSGGALVQSDGALIGLASAIFSTTPGVKATCGTAPGAVTPIDANAAFIDEALNAGAQCRTSGVAAATPPTPEAVDEPAPTDAVEVTVPAIEGGPASEPEPGPKNLPTASAQGSGDDDDSTGGGSGACTLSPASALGGSPSIAWLFVLLGAVAVRRRRAT